MARKINQKLFMATEVDLGLDLLTDIDECFCKAEVALYCLDDNEHCGDCYMLMGC